VNKKADSGFIALITAFQVYNLSILSLTLEFPSWCTIKSLVLGKDASRSKKMYATMHVAIKLSMANLVCYSYHYTTGKMSDATNITNLLSKNLMRR